MEFTSESSGTTLILTVAGRLSSAMADVFEHQVGLALDHKPAVLLVDFAGLEFITSAGLRILILALKRAKAEGRQIHLCGLSEPVHEVFEVSGLVQIFPIHPGRAAALAALETGGGFPAR